MPKPSFPNVTILAAAALFMPGVSSIRAQAPAAPVVLAATSFKPITNDDLGKWDSSGCSFLVKRGKDILAIFDTADQKKTALFKIDGKILKVPVAKATDKTSYWSGNVAGTEVRLFKGKRDPKVKNDGGGQGGVGKIEWTTAAGLQSITGAWEEGC